MSKAIDELRELIQEVEESNREYGLPVPVNCEIEIEASLAYRLISEWPKRDDHGARRAQRERALKACGEVYDFIRLS